MGAELPEELSVSVRVVLPGTRINEIYLACLRSRAEDKLLRSVNVYFRPSTINLLNVTV